jgi:phosphate transport system permease protein
MSLNFTLSILLLLVISFYYFGQRKALHLKSSGKKLHSLPFYYGSWLIIVGVLPGILFLSLWSAFDGTVIRSIILSDLPLIFQSYSGPEKDLLYSEILNFVGDRSQETYDDSIISLGARYSELSNLSMLVKFCLATVLAISGFIYGWSKISHQFRARNTFEKMSQNILLICASLAILTTVGIIFSVLFESIRFFEKVSFFEFVFGTHWSPQIAIREDQVGSSGAFGAVPLFVGTLLVSFIAMIVAVPIGLMSAIYLSEYASPLIRAYAKPLLEILAGIPTVVYGFFAAITVAPLLRDFGDMVGLSIASESALAAGIVMGVMIIPFVSSLSDDIINAVPQSLRDGSFALGATHSETIVKVILPAALPGIVGAILLAISRAIGETMIVVMAAGLSANLTFNPLETVTTVTVQIVTLLVGDQEFDSAKTLAAFALGLMLFFTTLFLNVIALYVVRKYREQYE